MTRVLGLWRRAGHRASGSGLAGVLALAAAVSCSTANDSEAFVPSQRGAVQPDGGGALVSEAVACASLQAAESDARRALGCEAVDRSCPARIRPAAGAACFRYDQATIDACAALYGSFETCADFELHPCLITAVSRCEVTAGEAGAGGASGGGGDADSSDAAGTAGAIAEVRGGAGGA